MRALAKQSLRRPIPKAVLNPPPQQLRWRPHSSSPQNSRESLDPSANEYQLAPPPPQPPTTLHHDLPSFLAHAHRTALSSTSSVYVGTHYEYTCLSTLARLSFSLTRTGGRSDHGVDLLGSWTLPSVANSIPIIAQCKNVGAGSRPNMVRELEGTFGRAPRAWARGVAGDPLGMLVATKPATEGVRKAVFRCGTPIMWVMVEDLGGGVGCVRQLLWNERATALGLGEMGVTTRYLPSATGGKLEKEVVLTWKGEPWEPV